MNDRPVLECTDSNVCVHAYGSHQIEAQLSVSTAARSLTVRDRNQRLSWQSIQTPLGEPSAGTAKIRRACRNSLILISPAAAAALAWAVAIRSVRSCMRYLLIAKPSQMCVYMRSKARPEAPSAAPVAAPRGVDFAGVSEYSQRVDRRPPDFLFQLRSGKERRSSNWASMVAAAKPKLIGGTITHIRK